VTSRPYPPAAARLLEAYRAAIDAGLPLGLGSNAWAVSAEHTRTGAPLLASDPHVGSSVPALFHVSHIRGGDANAIGADIPGVPGIVIGHNDSVAWGITAGMANVADCYIEEFDPEQPLRYRKRMSTSSESICAGADPSRSACCRRGMGR
jgi:penicillin amidase